MNATARSLRNFRTLALVEGISFLLILFVTVPLKKLYGIGEPNKVVGMAHGLLFIGYCIYALQHKWEQGWSVGKLLLLWLAAVVPFGTFVADWKILKPAQLAASRQAAG